MTMPWVVVIAFCSFLVGAIWIMAYIDHRRRHPKVKNRRSTDPNDYWSGNWDGEIR